MISQTPSAGSPLSACLPTCCPICECESGIRDLTLRIRDGKIYVCGRCAGYFLYPATEIDYNGSSWTTMRHEKWEEDVARGTCHAKALAEWFESKTGKSLRSILEIGCGSGFMGPGFDDIGVRYEGIDVDRELIDVGVSRGLELRCLAAEGLGESEIAQEHFDLVLSSNTFEHVSSPRRVFEGLSRMSFDLGVIIVPNPEGLLQRAKATVAFRRVIQWYQRNTREIAYSIDGVWHNIAYSRKTFLYLCKAYGLPATELHSRGINDRVFGFVQPNTSLAFRAASAVMQAIDADSLLYLLIDRRSSVSGICSRHVSFPRAAALSSV